MGQPEQTTETSQGVNVDKNETPAADDNEQKSPEPNMGQPEQTMEMAEWDIMYVHENEQKSPEPNIGQPKQTMEIAEGVIVEKNGPPAAGVDESNIATTPETAGFVTQQGPRETGPTAPKKDTSVCPPEENASTGEVWTGDSFKPPFRYSLP
ncbi:uncharacterized protein LOC113334230 isoform X3 [Papaver somniferum]|uniref:uncharacterized protein LOC113334230 isoform X3 n=1 Tax=Papaver somniferum TaxID=3469 RepID=UPI000E6FAE1E|nr:uncharacterized protein LOC113334230 isoform X3 [Papaver somniferum]